MIDIRPQTALSWAKNIMPISGVLCFILLSAGLYFALFNSPPDYQQGESVRIMYVHVPSAWMSLMLYVTMAFAGIAFLIWRGPISSILAHGAALIGIQFAFITLVTGALWGQPIWGAWWVWDARLTSMLILFFFFAGYLLLYNGFDNEERGAKSAAILGVIGLINVPIVKFSVEWWNTLHQPASILRKGGIAIDDSMLLPLLLMYGAFFMYYLFVGSVHLITSLSQRRLRRRGVSQQNSHPNLHRT